MPIISIIIITIIITHNPFKSWVFKIFYKYCISIKIIELITNNGINDFFSLPLLLNSFSFN